jgi:hypothetical protein
MDASNCLDDLIECLWQVLGSGMDKSSEFPCREKCLECLEQLVGTDHHYTRCFKNFVHHSDEISILTAGGILNALKEEIDKKQSQNQPAENSPLRHHGAEQQLKDTALQWPNFQNEDPKGE